MVIFFTVLCTYFSIHSTNFVRNMIPTFLRFKVCDSQRTFYLDQSSRSTTVQSYGKGEVHINCHKSQKFALFQFTLRFLNQVITSCLNGSVYISAIQKCNNLKKAIAQQARLRRACCAIAFLRFKLLHSKVKI